MSTKGYVEANFQRDTNVEELEKELGRSPTDEEVDRAKQNPYSVDGVFCKQCEDLFSKIENEFLAQVLPSFRGTYLSEKRSISIANVRLARLFWYLQVWRSAVCVPAINISETTKETLRGLILNYQTIQANELTSFPIAVSYLQTLGGDKELTTNFVGFINERNPLLIFMCDFVVQFFESDDKLQFKEMFGLNSNDSKDFVNFKEKEFKVKILFDEQRIAFIKAYRLADAKDRIDEYAADLSRLWLQLFNARISHKLLHTYISELTDNPDHDILHYSKENVLKITMEFIKRNAPK